ncbi:GerAB/ArcD/ProY family transporter [Syntrophomonas curvata]
MQSTTLSSRQAAFILFMILVGNALVLAPATAAGRSAWISNLLAALVGLYIIAVIIGVQKAFPGQSIIKTTELCLGKLAGKLLNFIYITAILYATIVYLFDACIIIRTILPFVTCNILRPLMMLAAAYCIYKGVNAVGRLTEVLAPVVLLLVIMSFILMFIVTDFSRLQPVLADWKALLGGVIESAGWPYSSISSLALFLPFVNDLAEKKRPIYICYLAGVSVVALRSLLIMAVLGPEMTILLRFPLYSSLRTLALADFQRVELFFFILWFICGFTVLMINYLAASLALKDYIELPRLNPLVLPLGFFLTVISLYMYNSDMEFYALGSVTTPLISLTVNLLYLTVILIAVKLRKQTG